MKIALTLGGVAVVLIVAYLFFIYSGIYSVAATNPDNAFMSWTLTTLKRNAIQDRAESIEVPPLSDTAMVRAGAQAFQEMCVTCHGAPGAERSEIGKGIYPEPPRLSEAAERWGDAEIYWILENGIKLAGMPAFGPTHSEEELWKIAAFVRQLPEMSPEAYQRWLGSAGGEEGHGGDHGH